MKYFRIDYVTGEKKEISYDQALEIMLGTWKDTEMTRDMLSIVNRIECRYSTIEAEDPAEGKQTRALKAGLCNMLPNGVEYDDNGNRI